MRITENKPQPYESSHAAQIAKLAPECTVLLKKDGRFPLKDVGTLALYGAGVRHTICGGTGSGEVNIRRFQNIEDAILDAGFTITTKSWLDGYDAALAQAGEQFYQQMKVVADAAGIPVSFAAVGQSMPEPEYSLPLEGSGDTAVYVLARDSGEGADRKSVPGDISLTQTEICDILALNSQYKNFMLVLNVGGIVDLTPVVDVKNILLLGQLGTPTAQVLVDILTGRAYPSGKLTATWAALENYPSTQGFGDLNDTIYREGVYVGYRYFDLADKAVLYPFGYGLGYTDFSVQAEQVDCLGDRITVMSRISNVGSHAGKEVVQLYVTAPGKEIDRPWKELAGTAKTRELNPGESEIVGISFDLSDHTYYEEKSSAYILEGGRYLLHLGVSSHDTRCVGFVDVPQAFSAQQLQAACPPQKMIPALPEQEKMQAKRKTLYEKAVNEGVDLPVVTVDLTSRQTRTVDYAVDAQADTQTTGEGADFTWDDVLTGKIDVTAFAASLTDEELARLACGSTSDNMGLGSIIGSASEKVAGAAGETTRKLMDKRNVPSIVLADGPAGVRICPIYTLEGERAKPAAMSFGSGMAAFLQPEEIAVMRAAMGIADITEGVDAYYQYCTAIPIGTAIAQSFNPALARSYGEIVGSEMELFGVQLWLAPALNIQRSPLCGRNFEYYSEDPWVSGNTAAALTMGVQQHPKCGVTIKHFACNNQETNRYRNNSVVSERAMREIYLKGFEICVRTAKPASVMTSYNLINGEHACNSADLLTHILRNEWGFEGIVMTDWFVTSAEISAEKASIHPEASAAGCVKAGNNLVMPGLASDVADIHSALKDPTHRYCLNRNILIQNAVQMLCCIQAFS